MTTWPEIRSRSDVEPAWSELKACVAHVVDLVAERFPTVPSTIGDRTLYAWLPALLRLPDVQGVVEPIDLNDPPYDLNNGSTGTWQERDAELRFTKGVMGTLVTPEQAFWANVNGLELLKAHRRAGHRNRDQVRTLARYVDDVLYPALAWHWVLLGEQYVDQVARLEAIPPIQGTASPSPPRKPTPSWH